MPDLVQRSAALQTLRDELGRCDAVTSVPTGQERAGPLGPQLDEVLATIFAWRSRAAEVWERSRNVSPSDRALIPSNEVVGHRAAGEDTGSVEYEARLRSTTRDYLALQPLHHPAVSGLLFAALLDRDIQRRIQTVEPGHEREWRCLLDMWCDAVDGAPLGDLQASSELQNIAGLGHSAFAMALLRLRHERASQLRQRLLLPAAEVKSRPPAFPNPRLKQPDAWPPQDAEAWLSADEVLRRLLQQRGALPRRAARWPTLRQSLREHAQAARQELAGMLRAPAREAWRERDRSRALDLCQQPTTDLDELIAAVEAWLRPSSEAQRANAELAELLSAFLDQRQQLLQLWPEQGREPAATAGLETERLAEIRLCQLAQLPWRASPRLRAIALGNLWLAKLSQHWPHTRGIGMTTARQLYQLWCESEAGILEPSSVVRRLRQLERQGVHLHNQAWQLLALEDKASSISTAGDEPYWPRPSARWARQMDAQELLRQEPYDQLLAQLGFCPAAEVLWPELRQRLEQTIEVTIPDFDALRQALLGIGEVVHRERDDKGTTATARRQRWADPLLQSLLAAGEDQEVVLALLSRAPVSEPLVFVEEIPVLRRDQVIWRAPVEISLLRKRPRDRNAFRQLLDQAEALLQPARHPQQRLAREEAAEAIGRVRRGMERSETSLPALLRHLNSRVQAWLSDAHPERHRKRRQALQQLVAQALELRPRYGQGWPLPEQDAHPFREHAAKHARRYLDEAWLHHRALARLLLSNLLAAELAWQMTQPQMPPRQGLQVLFAVFHEVSSGHHHAAVDRRRLEALESVGIYVHGLVLELLEHLTPNQAPTVRSRHRER